MEEEKRTEVRLKRLENSIGYSVYYNCVIGGDDGCECERVEAQTMDNHYLLVSTKTWKSQGKVFGVVDINHPDEANKRLYKKAKELAEERLRRWNGQARLTDLTEPKEAETGSSLMPDFEQSMVEISKIRGL